MKYIEHIGEFKPANWQKGNHFFMLNSLYVNYAFDPEISYAPSCVCIYQEIIYQRNENATGYQKGTLPTETAFFTPIGGKNNQETGRYLGAFTTLLDLEDHIIDEAIELGINDYAAILESRCFVSYNMPNQQWIKHTGRLNDHFSSATTLMLDETEVVNQLFTVENQGLVLRANQNATPILLGSQRPQLVVNFNSNNDTVSSPILFKGAVASPTTFLGSELQSYSYEAKIDEASANYTALASDADLATWIFNNIYYSDTLWKLRVIVQYNDGETGETSAILEYTRVLIPSSSEGGGNQA